MQNTLWNARWVQTLTGLVLALEVGALAAAQGTPNLFGDSPSTRPVLVELFTSQSCSSCPPADAVLRGLAARADVLPLSFHVDYWNGLGWVDRYSSPANTARQQDYASRQGFHVYTPQMVIDGREDVVGSDGNAVARAVVRAQARAGGAPATILRKGTSVNATIGTIPGRSEAAAADVYMVSFDPSRSTDVRGGENSGRSLSYANVVRSMRKIGEWKNRDVSFSEHLNADEPGERLALIAQDQAGTVWAAATTPAP